MIRNARTVPRDAWPGASSGVKAAPKHTMATDDRQKGAASAEPVDEQTRDRDGRREEQHRDQLQLKELDDSRTQGRTRAARAAPVP